LKDLSQILPRKTGFDLIGDPGCRLSGFTMDSRNVRAGDLFVAVKGSVLDGHAYISGAISKGAVAILCEVMSDDQIPGICYIRSDSVMDCLSEMLGIYYDDPCSKITLVGITGTNGKTTVATLCYELFNALGHKSGLISTVENKFADRIIPSTHTTPDMISLYGLLNEMVVAGCTHVFMEVSSHAVDQGRIKGLNYKLAVFTNITQDHLDYHHTFKNYIDAKKKFFDNLSRDSISLVNADDSHASIMVQNSKSIRKTFGVRNMADYKLKILDSDLSGMHLKSGMKEWHSNLAGTFNASNLAAVLGVALELGENEDEVIRLMSGLHSVSGRFDWIRDPDTGKVGVVDYAHTPDAVEKLIRNIQHIRRSGQRIITVIGCGGNRDKSKRPLMGRIAVDLSDQVILTSDNPRDEEPLDIIKDMESGISAGDQVKYLVQPDREQAIKTACLIAKDHDIIVLAGKGHEKYQEVKGVKTPFDDMQKLKTYLFKI